MGIADELITRGWHQGAYEHEVTGAVCLEGAAQCSVLGTVSARLGRSMTKAESRAVSRAYWALADARPADQGYSVVSFNDSPERTYDEVLRVAKLADELLDGEV